jgi:hypothetical protein
MKPFIVQAGAFTRSETRFCSAWMQRESQFRPLLVPNDGGRALAGVQLAQLYENHRFQCFPFFIGAKRAQAAYLAFRCSLRYRIGIGATGAIGADAAFGSRDEFKEDLAGRKPTDLLGIRHRLTEIFTRAKKRAVQPFNLDTFIGGQTSAPHPDDVQTAQFVHTVDDGVWRQIEADRRTPPHDGHGAHAAELMNETVCRDECTILSRRITAQRRAIGDNNGIANLAIVAHMAVSHEIVMRTDHGLSRRRAGSIDCDVLAKNVPLADDQRGWLAAIFKVLGSLADHATSKEPVIRSNDCAPREIGIRTDDASGPDLHMLINDHIRSHRDRRIELRFGMNDGSRMNHGLKSGTSGRVAKPKLGESRQE